MTVSRSPTLAWTVLLYVLVQQAEANLITPLVQKNVAALPVSMGGMVEDFGVPPTVVSSTIVVYGRKPTLPSGATP